MNPQLLLLLSSPPPLAVALGFSTIDLDLRRLRFNFWVSLMLGFDFSEMVVLGFIFCRLLCLWVAGISLNVLKPLIETLAYIYIYIFKHYKLSVLAKFS